MTFVDRGIQAAYRQTWRKGDPRPTLAKVIEENPKAHRDTLFRLFRERVIDDAEAIDSCLQYYFDRTLASIERSITETEATTVTHKRMKKEKIKASVQLQGRMNHEAKRILLDWVMPNNKTLADCTGEDCAKLGGWLRAIAKDVPKNKTVGDVFNEKQLYAIYRSAQ
jgi:hypothetical protein